MQNTNDRSTTDQRMPNGSADNVNSNTDNRSSAYPSSGRNNNNGGSTTNTNTPSSEDTDEE